MERNFLDRMHSEEKKAAGIKSLLASVVAQAVMDVAYAKYGGTEAARAMMYLLGRECRDACAECGLDYGKILENSKRLYRRKQAAGVPKAWRVRL